VKKPLSRLHVEALWQAMLRRFRATRISKSSAFEMQLVASFLSAAGITDRNEFLKHYATTIGRRIYLPFAPGLEQDGWTLWAQVIVCAHECQHVVQLDRVGTLPFYFQYVTSTAKRTMFEAEAYRSALELSWWRSKTMPSPKDLAASLRGYGVTKDDLLVAEKALAMSAEAVRRGAVMNVASRAVIEWLEARVT
jgi:hypothetical protein